MHPDLRQLLRWLRSLDRHLGVEIDTHHGEFTEKHPVVSSIIYVATYYLLTDMDAPVYREWLRTAGYPVYSGQNGSFYFQLQQGILRFG